MDCINELRDSLNVHLGWNRLWSSRPEELPLQPLTERYVNLSIHTALVKQTRPLFRMPNEQTTWVYP
jgi:hypothetical protein